MLRPSPGFTPACLPARHNPALQSACYVIALRQMAKQGIGHPAYTMITKMKVGRWVQEAGTLPMLRCLHAASIPD